jgi:hypothetical protein
LIIDGGYVIVITGNLAIAVEEEDGRGAMAVNIEATANRYLISHRNKVIGRIMGTSSNLLPRMKGKLENIRFIQHGIVVIVGHYQPLGDEIFWQTHNISAKRN